MDVIVAHIVLSVSVLARDYDMSFAAVQKHVAVLEAAGLIIKRAEGRERLVRADPAMIARACGPSSPGVKRTVTEGELYLTALNPCEMCGSQRTVGTLK